MGVFANELHQRVVVDAELTVFQAVSLHGFWNQELPRDLQLFDLGVAWYLDDLHTVTQCCRNRVEHVGCRDKYDLRQVERHFKVVVREGVVLLRVQYLKQRRGWIAAECIRADLVDLVEDDDRIVGASVADCLDHASGHCPDIGAAMPANFSFVTHSTERHACVGASEGTSNGFAEARLTDTRRPDETDNW